MSYTHISSTLPLEWASIIICVTNTFPKIVSPPFLHIGTTWVKTCFKSLLTHHVLCLPTIERSPSISTKRRNFNFASGLVKISDVLSSVGMYMTSIFLSSTASRMKWYRMSICLVRAWNLLSLDNAIAPWLLQLIVNGASCKPRISFRKLRNHKASLAAWVCAIYSASVLDNAIMYCFFELQDTAPLPIWNEYPEIECRCFWPAQSASQYPSTRVLVRPPKVSHRSLVHPR